MLRLPEVLGERGRGKGMKIENTYAWQVTLTHPVRDGERTYTRNETVTAVASDPVAAAQLAMAEYPGCKVWSINHCGSKTVLLVSPPMGASQ